jgi:hypothetical protein
VCACWGERECFDAFEEISYYPNLILGVPESTQDMIQCAIDLDSIRLLERKITQIEFINVFLDRGINEYNC